MKKITTTILSTMLAFGTLQAQTARVQVIHNCADPGAASVDVYANGAILLDNFNFRTARPFQSLPAGVPIEIAIAGPLSASAAEAIHTQTVTFMANETYILVARGVTAPTNFASNPEGASTAFTLELISGAREAAVNSGDVDVKIFHNATDAPAVDVIARDVATLVDDAPYPANTGYLSVPPSDYLIDITPAADNATIVGTWNAPLSGLAGQAISVLASGFLGSGNQGGASFGLIAVLNDGTVLELSDTSLANVQIVHNSADPNAASVDIYVNGNLEFNDFLFRTATQYLTVPAGVELSFAVAPGTSASVADALATFPVTFDNGKKYIVFANGVLNPSDFAVNPDGRSTAFTLVANAGQREVAATPGNVEFRVFHGATDAPTVDAIAAGSVNVADNAAYTDLTGYSSVPPAAYTIDLTPGANNNAILLSYFADLSANANATAVVFASGFLDPAANQGGAAFGLFAVLPDGTVLALDNVTGIENQTSTNTLSTYPVPASSVISFNGMKGSAEVTVTDVNGRDVLTTSITTNSMDISSLANGLYSLRIINNENTYTTRVVVSK